MILMMINLVAEPHLYGQQAPVLPQRVGGVQELAQRLPGHGGDGGHVEVAASDQLAPHLHIVIGQESADLGQSEERNNNCGLADFYFTSADPKQSRSERLMSSSLSVATVPSQPRLCSTSMVSLGDQRATRSRWPARWPLWRMYLSIGRPGLISSRT